MRSCLALLLLALAAPAVAADAGTPAKVTVCAACHGADGRSTQPVYPHLAGQYSSYLEHALREYRDGTRKNAIMGAQAQGLTDAEIRQLAAYYAGQKGPLYTPGLQVRQSAER